jgi:C-terminal processing protease CtpA/Prc
MCIVLKTPLKKKSSPIEVTIQEGKQAPKGEVKPKQGDGPRELSDKEKAALAEKAAKAQAEAMSKARAEARKMAQQQLAALGMLHKQFPELFGNHNHVLEKVPGIMGKPNTRRTGYYGIGIEDAKWQDVIFNGQIIHGSEVTQVFAGYPADENGILVGDVIVEVDGHLGPSGQAIIIGESDAPIHLTIWRNGRIIEFSFKRGWVVTDGTSGRRNP